MKEKEQTKKHKDIARIDQDSKRTHGWYVRVRFEGKTHTKFFSDLKLGGLDASLIAAVTWRNQTEIKLGKIRTDKNLVTTSNKSTGVVGVSLNEKLNRYDVSWVKKDGTPRKSSVSILKHGKEKAFQIACEKRKQKEAERLC